MLGLGVGVGGWEFGLGTVLREPMQDVSPTDRRYSQTQDRYAADDLETMQEARRYTDHVFGLVRGFLGSRVLEVGSGIGTMTSRLVDVADRRRDRTQTQLRDARSGGHGRAPAVHPARLPLRGMRCRGAGASAIRLGRLSVNVLEHIADDVSALKAFKTDPRPRRPCDRLRARIADGVWSSRCRARPSSPLFEAHAPRGVASAGLELIRLRYTNPIGLAGWMDNAHVSKSTSTASRR